MKAHFLLFYALFFFNFNLKSQIISWDTIKDSTYKLSGTGMLVIVKIPDALFTGIIQNTTITIKGDSTNNDSTFNILLKNYLDSSHITQQMLNEMNNKDSLKIPFGKFKSIYKATSVIFNFKANNDAQGVNVIFIDTAVQTQTPRIARVDIKDLKAFSCECPANDKNEDIKNALKFCPDCKDNDVYVYDASCKSLFKKRGDKYEKITNLAKLKFKYNKEFKVKLIHVNRYLNDIEITAEDSIYESQAPALFNNIFGGNSDLMAKLLDASKNQLQDATKSLLDILIDSVRSFNSYINALREIRESVNYQCCEPTLSCDTKHRISAFTIKNTLDQIEAIYTKLSLELIEHKKDVEKKLLDIFWTSFNSNKPSLAQIDTLVTFYNNFSKENYTFTTSSIFPKGNRTTLVIRITPKETLSLFKDGLQPPNPHYLKVDGLVRNKWFVSFSSGPFLGICEKLYVKSYEFKKLPSTGGNITDTSKFLLVESGKTPQPVGLCALANIEKKVSSYFGYGLSIGAGLTAEKTPRLNYLLGSSVFFGDQHQFGITAGATGMQANVLKKDLYPDFQIYSNSTESLKYSKDFRVGAFFSLTYTFFTMKSAPNSTSKTNK